MKFKLITLKDIIEKNSSTVNPRNEPDAIISYIDISSIDNQRFKISKPKLLQGKDAPSRARKKIKKGDVLFATTRPNLKNIALVEKDYNTPICSTGFCVLRSDENQTIPKYIYFFLQTENVQIYIEPFIRGAQYPAISDKNLLSCKIPLPPLSEQERIVKKLDSLFERIDKSITLLEENIKHTESIMPSALNEVFEKGKEKWEMKEIEQIAEVKGGKRLPKGEKLQEEPTDYPYIRVADFLNNGSIDLNTVKYITQEIFNKISRYTISTKDVYISIAGTIGKTGIIPDSLEGANLTENAAKFVFKSESDIYNRYIYYFTITHDFINQIGLATKVVAQPKLALTRLKKVQLPLPMLSEQKQIIDYLNNLSEKTTATLIEQRAKLANLKALKASILDSAFKGEL